MFKQIGKTFTVYNIHSLLHICDDVENFICSLNKLSCFPFENYLHKLKKVAKNANNPTAQIVKHVISEETNYESNLKTNTEKVASNSRDNCFFNEDGKLIFIRFLNNDNTYECDVYAKSCLKSFYDHPIDSKLLGIYFLEKNQDFSKLTFHKNELRKCVCLPFKSGFVIYPVIHLV